MKEWKLNQKIDLLNQFRTMFFNTFVTCYFGKQFNQFSYKDQSYGKAISTSFQKLLYQGVSLRHMLFGTKFLQKGYLKEDRQIQQRVSAIKIQTKQFVQKRWKDILNNEGQNSGSILSKIVFNQSFRNLDEQQKQKALQSFTGDLIMFFFASTDTTSASLVATLHILNKYPEVTKRLIEQLNKSPNDYKHSTIKSWRYMDAVFNQILRLYGPFNWIIVRQFISNGYTLGGVNIPKDVIIAIQSQTIHCTQKYFQNPYDFNPDRFFGQKNQQPYSFVAFGGGLRNCIGQYLAKIQYKMALAKFLRTFNFQTEDQMVLSLTSIYMSQNNNFVLQKMKN